MVVVFALLKHNTLRICTNTLLSILIGRHCLFLTRVTMGVSLVIPTPHTSRSGWLVAQALTQLYPKLPLPLATMAATWLNVNAGAAPAPPTARVRAVGSTSKDALQRELNHMLLAIQTAQTNRQMQASAWKTWLTPGELVADPIATNKAHAEQTKGISGHKHGPPHVQSYRAFIAKLINMAAAKATEETDKNHVQLLQQHLTNYEASGVQQGWTSIDQFRVRLTKEGQGIVNYQLSTMLEPAARHQIEFALAVTLKLIDSEVRPGAPPRSDAERKLQISIDELKSQLAAMK
jgi:hypothetical protein